MRLCIQTLRRWEDRVKEYMCKRGTIRMGRIEQARRECLDRERWRLFCCGDVHGGSEVSEQ